MRGVVLGVATLAAVGVVGFGVWRMVQVRRAPPSAEGDTDPEAEDFQLSPTQQRLIKSRKFFDTSSFIKVNT